MSREEFMAEHNAAMQRARALRRNMRVIDANMRGDGVYQAFDVQDGAEMVAQTILSQTRPNDQGPIHSGNWPASAVAAVTLTSNTRELWNKESVEHRYFDSQEELDAWLADLSVREDVRQQVATYRWDWGPELVGHLHF